jgi:hypothetical protein
MGRDGFGNSEDHPVIPLSKVLAALLGLSWNA